MESEAGQLPVTHKAWAWFEANKKATLWGVGVLAVAGVVVAFWLYRQDEAEIAASEALSLVSLPQYSAAGGQPEVAERYLKVAASYPKSGAGARALLLAAGSMFVEGKYGEAKAQFERFRREYADSPFSGEALLGIAACLNAQGKTRDAMAAYKDLIERRAGDQVLPQARFALACLYEAQNEPERARNLFEEVERTDPYSSLGSEAGMRVEELKMKYPNLWAAVPMPTSAVPAPTASSALPTSAPTQAVTTPAQTKALPTAASTNGLPLKVEKPR